MEPPGLKCSAAPTACPKSLLTPISQDTQRHPGPADNSPQKALLAPRALIQSHSGGNLSEGGFSSVLRNVCFSRK